MKTRFAPSPTGMLHVGGLRTALYAYLYARQNGGTFILRIEDTDQKREVAGALENLFSTLRWAGLEWDEGPEVDGIGGGTNGPYIQSERTEIYREHTLLLLERGAAYHCFCTAERLTKMREEQEKRKLSPMYDRACLKLSADEVKKKLAAGEPAVVRQKIPSKEELTQDWPGGYVQFTDIIRKKVSVDPATVDDQVLLKSDNFPTYHLANVVDDHFMGVTHVIRGEEWLPSTPKHLLLYRAFGWEPPQFAHLPLLLNPDKTKLSKRQGHVAVEEYIKEGFIREAVLNFIALLGWHPSERKEASGDASFAQKNHELFSIDELIRAFELERVQKGGAVFDFEKLKWFNWQWRKRNFDAFESESEKIALLKEYCGHLIPADWHAAVDRRDADFLNRVLLVMSEKICKDGKEAIREMEFFFRSVPAKISEELMMNEKMKVDMDSALEAVRRAIAALEGLNGDEWSLPKIQERLLALAADWGVKNGQLLWPLRVALTGEKFSPGAFEVLWVFGKDESLKRLKEYAV